MGHWPPRIMRCSRSGCVMALRHPDFCFSAPICNGEVDCRNNGRSIKSSLIWQKDKRDVPQPHFALDSPSGFGWNPPCPLLRNGNYLLARRWKQLSGRRSLVLACQSHLPHAGCRPHPGESRTFRRWPLKRGKHPSASHHRPFPLKHCIYKWAVRRGTKGGSHNSIIMFHFSFIEQYGLGPNLNVYIISIRGWAPESSIQLWVGWLMIRDAIMSFLHRVTTLLQFNRSTTLLILKVMLVNGAQ